MANEVQKLVLGFLVLILGVALIGSVATSTVAVTDKIGASSEAIDLGPARLVDDCNWSINESYPFTITNAPTGWKSADCPITNFVMLNQTDVTTTVTTDYVFFDNNGTLYLRNTTNFMNVDCSVTANDTTIFYDYCADGYINSAWSRNVLDLVIGFFALALLGAGLGLFYSVAKDAGILN